VSKITTKQGANKEIGAGCPPSRRPELTREGTRHQLMSPGLPGAWQSSKRRALTLHRRLLRNQHTGSGVAGARNCRDDEGRVP